MKLEVRNNIMCPIHMKMFRTMRYVELARPNLFFINYFFKKKIWSGLILSFIYFYGLFLIACAAFVYLLI